MASFFFYDLETSGLSPSCDRVMQFAGQRTDMDLQPIGQPVNLLVKLPEDILPSPEALLVTGITPQQAADGISEAEFARILSEEIFTPGTIATGFNNVRFDDGFVRHILWRNFYDPYAWAWEDGRSRWDLLDVVRLVRALRPDGIKWPVDKEGKSVNKLELLSKINKLEHTKAHDALSDVEALIGLTRLIRDKQPKMWDYLFKMRDKKEVMQLVNLDNPVPFVYASGRYQTPEKTTVAFPIAPGRRSGTALVYDLRIDPEEIVFTPQTSTLSSPGSDPGGKGGGESLPVKELAYNRCPAVAPLSVLDEKSQERLQINLAEIEKNLANLEKNRGIVDKIVAKWNERPEFPPATDVEGRLYDSFTPDADKARAAAVRSASPEDLADFHPDFVDERLPELLFRYKARNFPQALSSAERDKWEQYRRAKFARELPGLSERLAQLAVATDDSAKQFVLAEIQLWIESIMPVE